MTQTNRPSEQPGTSPRALSAEELEIFNRQIITAARTGAPLVPALKALGRDLRRGRLKRALESLVEDLRNGKSLSQALASHPNEFPPLYSAMAEAAASSGNLLGVMEMVNNLVISGAGLRRQIVAAASYPLAVLVASAGLLGFLVLGPLRSLIVMAQSAEMGDEMKGLAIVQFAGLIPLGVIALFLLGLLVLRVIPGGTQLRAKVAMRVPFYGRVVRAQQSFIFSRTFALLLRAGVPMRQAIDVVARIVSLRSQREALMRVGDRLQRGSTLREAMMEERACFPATLIWTVSVAESRGDLPQGLYEASEYYREEGERQSAFMMEVLPTFMILVAGATVAAVVFPVFFGLFRVLTMLTRFGG